MMRSRAMRRANVRYYWDRMKVSLWFIPLVMAIAALILLWLISWLENLLPRETLRNIGFLLTTNVSEMRNLLIGMAATVLGTAGVVFSLLTLPLGTVASQYGSRLLRVFLRDRTTQLVLGVFVGTFTYCLAAAMALPPSNIQVETSRITFLVGSLLMLTTFASLIVLIQHITTMLQAPNIVASAGEELLDIVSEQVADEFSQRQERGYVSGDFDRSLIDEQGYPIQLKKTGYIQFVDPQIVLELAKEKDLVVRVLRKPGFFVAPGAAAALVLPLSQVDARMEKQIRRAFQIGNMRTPTQDFEYAINQLVEVAVRAMSPAINDPFTAMTCLDYIAQGLAKFAGIGERSPGIYDDSGRLRVIFEPVTFAELVDAAFNMLRHASCDNASVLLHILDAIETISLKTEADAAQRELLRHIKLVQTESQAGALIQQDQRRIQIRCEALEKKLEETIQEHIRDDD